MKSGRFWGEAEGVTQEFGRGYVKCEMPTHSSKEGNWISESEVWERGLGLHYAFGRYQLQMTQHLKPWDW